MISAHPAPVSSDEFESWVREYRLSMHRLAASMSTAQDAEEAVQEALARAWARRETFDPSRGSPRAWLMAIVADQVRGRRRRKPPDMYLTVGGARASTPGPNPLRTDVRSAVDRLARRQRMAVILFYYVDLPIAEIAQVMRCAEGSVKSALHDARARLAEQLEGHQ
jgi:RNA polymerase sigma-70 factor (ECF subfamily)